MCAEQFSPTTPDASAAEITARERDVLILVASGKTTREIARELQIASKTVACHRSRMMSKLACRNASDVTRAAIRMRLINA